MVEMAETEASLRTVALQPFAFLCPPRSAAANRSAWTYTVSIT